MKSCHRPSRILTPFFSYHPVWRMNFNTSGCASIITCSFGGFGRFWKQASIFSSSNFRGDSPSWEFETTYKSQSKSNIQYLEVGRIWMIAAKPLHCFTHDSFFPSHHDSDFITTNLNHADVLPMFVSGIVQFRIQESVGRSRCRIVSGAKYKHRRIGRRSLLE